MSESAISEVTAETFRPEVLSNPDYLRRIQVENRVQLCVANAKFLRKAFGYSLSTTFAIILLQGFQLFGFHLNDTFLNWLGGWTVGQTAGLLTMVVRQK